MSDFRPQLEAKIKSLGVSPQGERFLMKSLYPPGDLTQVSIPDSSWHPTFRFDSRPSFTVSAPSGVASTALYDVLILCPPGDVTAAYVVTATAGTNFRSSVTPAQSSATQVRIPPTASSIQKNYGGYLRDAVGATFGADLRSFGSPLAVDSFRTTYRGVTVHNTSSDLYNGGSVIAAQCASIPVVDEGFVTWSRGATLTAATQSVLNVPLDETSLTQMCPGCEMTEARHGAFVPQRLLGPAQSFREEALAINRTSTVTGAGAVYSIHPGNTTVTSDAYIPTSLTIRNGSSAEMDPWWYNAIRNSLSTIEDTAFDNVATAIILFRGLPQQATLSVQCHVGLECVLDATSPFRSLTSASAAYDIRAMEAYYEVAARMPFSYPASYNSLGLLVPFLAKAISAVKDYIAPAVAAAAPIIREHVLPPVGRAINGSLLRLENRAGVSQVPSQPKPRTRAPARAAPRRVTAKKRPAARQNRKK